MIKNIFKDNNISNDDNIIIDLIFNIIKDYIDRFNDQIIDDDNIDFNKINIIILRSYIFEIYYDDNIYLYIKSYNNIIKDFLLYYIYYIK